MHVSFWLLVSTVILAIKLRESISGKVLAVAKEMAPIVLFKIY